MKGLNIGSGPVLLQSDHIEWENSDFADTESGKGWELEARQKNLIYKKRDFTKPMEDIADESIDYIVAWHILEHMGFPMERNAILSEWKRVLKPGGQIFLACPDIKKIAKHIVDGDGPWADWFICMVNVYGPYNGFIGDVHRWGYNEEDVARLFIQEFGFSQAQSMDQNMLFGIIGQNAFKLGFADYNVQVRILK